MACTGKSKVYVLDEHGQKIKGDNGRFLVEIDDTTGKPRQKPCEGRVMRDQKVCRAHGGNAPQAKAAASRRGIHREATAALHRLGVAPVADPLTALSQLAGEVLAVKDAIGARVNALAEIRYEDEKGAEQLRSEVVVFERALDRCAAVLATIAKLDIDRRLAAIEEAKARAVVAALDAGLAAGLAAAGVTGPLATEAATVARTTTSRHLRLA